MTKLYYLPPKKKQFDEIKEKAIEIWKTYDDTYNYATEKIEKIKDLENVRDNFMYILAMFDIFNQKKVIKKLNEKTKEAISIRLINGGNNKNYLETIGLWHWQSDKK